ncbi:MAG: hypothetical protein FWE97_01700 [Dehalococcoidia bacterium]|nr:hypothetical protein [Dehalococcoidia bacterium]
MAEKWSVAYENLRKFVADHPEIKIDATSVVIMGDIRTDFYRYFDIVRDTFVKEYCAAKLEEAYAVGKAYADISKLVQQEMSLEAIDVSGSLEGFLKDPLKSMRSALFTPLFDLLKNKTDETGFVAEAQMAIDDFYKVTYCEAYNRWGTMSLLHLLRSSCLWDGKPRDLDSNPHNHTEFFPGLHDDDVPELQQGSRLEFAYIQKASFVMPDVLVQSNYLNAYVSLKSQWYEARWKAKVLNEKLEWLDLPYLYSGLGKCLPNMTIHLARESADELRLLSDFFHMARPDIMLEFMEEDNWYDPQCIEGIILRNKMFSPRLGSYVISRVVVPQEAFGMLGAGSVADSQQQKDAVPQAVSAEIKPTEELIVEEVTLDRSLPSSSLPVNGPLSDLPDSIHVLNVGYDINALEPVVQALSQWLAQQDEEASIEPDPVELPLVNQLETEEVFITNQEQKAGDTPAT